MNLQQQRLPFATKYIRPMLLASLLLHGIALFVPLTPSSDTTTKDEETIAIAQLSALTPPPVPTPSPIATPYLSASTQPTPPTKPQPLPVQQVIIPQPVAQPVLQPQLSPSPTRAPSTDSSTTDASTAPTPEPTPVPPPFDPQVPRQNFQASLSNIDGVIGLQPEPSALENPELYFVNPGDRTSDWVAGISEMQWFNDRKPDEVLESLQQTYAGEGLVFEAIDEGYGGDLLYEVKTTEGEPFFFINLASGRGGASTILVVWATNPNEPIFSTPALSPNNAASP